MKSAFTRLTYRNAAQHSLLSYGLDAGYCAGVAYALLAITTALLPIGETRDWIQYFLIAGWAAVYVAGRFVSQGSACVHYLKLAFSAYAAIMLSQMLIAPHLNLQSLWIFVAAALLSFSSLHGLPMARGKRLGFAMFGAWLLSIIFLLFLTLLLGKERLAVSHFLYGLPFIAAIAFAAWVIGRPFARNVKAAAPHKAWHYLTHLPAIYIFILIAFDPAYLRDATTIHHWKAFLESASVVRIGGWLLWDVPSQYGFLQTLLIAWLPTETTWQSFYLVNATLLSLIAYAVFATLFRRYRSAGGYLLGLCMGVACLSMVLPSTMTPIAYPSTSAMRFFWVYPMAGFVFHLCRSQSKRFLPGHIIWVLGCLWSIESACFVTLIWLPSLVLLAGMKSVVRPAALLAATVLIILFYYLLMLGHAPDISLLFAYSSAYKTFMAMPMRELSVLPCWLALFFIFVWLLKSSRPFSPAIYAAAIAIWAMASYYIPFSEKFHITGTLPLLVYLSASLLLLLPVLPLPEMLGKCYEKAVFCLYAIILLGTMSHFNHWVFSTRDFLQPIHPMASRHLPAPSMELLKLSFKAGITPGSHVQLIYRDHRMEVSCFHKLLNKPWILPNTIVGFYTPLPAATYELLARRRMQTAADTGWIIESSELPSSYVPWVNTVLLENYQPVQIFESAPWRITKYERIPATR